ncbi:PTS lactose/cellobiose transporter subunit IIA [Breznakia pachnodae]|uniref:Cellobiose-specific phosphotransferase system component IIA n=1 Tax=Breznakia pachnodae TaxID=265178 RepID=A0ABU0E506_9FIRM|nr:PTS lactose/cellobiose transporter subunit IIA [Breznakia pachnodae]MDQ0361806.1 cellobiose-specific phosphotransferase system component IIA [Breznakia pachnodae]
MGEMMNENKNEEFEQSLSMMIAYAGDANAKVFDAFDRFNIGEKELAYQILDEAQEGLLKAHKYQFSFLSEDAEDGSVLPSVLMIHAMDICMIASNSIQYTRKLFALLDEHNLIG